MTKKFIPFKPRWIAEAIYFAKQGDIGGYPQCSLDLAKAYARGLCGVERDLDKAMYYAKRAKASGALFANFAMAYILCQPGKLFNIDAARVLWEEAYHIEFGFEEVFLRLLLNDVGNPVGQAFAREMVAKWTADAEATKTTRCEVSPGIAMHIASAITAPPANGGAGGKR